MTTVLPAASAGAMPQPTSRMGKFQGKMNPHGPQGWRTVQASCRGDGQRAAAFDVQGHLDEVAHRVDEVLHVALGLGVDLAAVEGLDLGDDRLAFLDLVGQPVQQHAALVRGELRPSRLWRTPRPPPATARSTSSGCMADHRPAASPMPGSRVLKGLAVRGRQPFRPPITPGSGLSPRNAATSGNGRAGKLQYMINASATSRSYRQCPLRESPSDFSTEDSSRGRTLWYKEVP